MGWEINRQARASGLDIIALNRRELDITKSTNGDAFVVNAPGGSLANFSVTGCTFFVLPLFL